MGLYNCGRSIALDALDNAYVTGFHTNGSNKRLATYKLAASNGQIRLE